MISRPHTSDSDFDAMLAFTAQCCRDVAPAPWDFHIGELIWQRHNREENVNRWPERVRFWEDDGGSILGVGFYSIQDRQLSLLVRPNAGANVALVESMIAWGNDRVIALPSEPDAGGHLSVEALGESALESTLLQLGWQQNDDPPMALFQRSLDDIPVPQLPDGFVVRPLSGPEEHADRVAVHREAFNPSTFTLPAYERVRKADGYDPDLDLVAVSPDGTFAAYCIAWFDAGNATGQFEPVGARESFRRQGLTKATLYSAMHRLAQKGATRVMVLSYSDSEPAMRLYRSADFEQVGEFRNFSLPS